LESLRIKSRKLNESKFHEVLERFKRTDRAAKLVYEDEWGSKLMICPHILFRNRIVLYIQPAETAIEIPASKFDEFLESLKKVLEHFREVMENEGVSERR